jgi:hypothetical protein
MSLFSALVRHARTRVARLTSVGAAPSAEADRIDTLRERLRAAEREIRMLRSVLAVDQAQRNAWDSLESTLDTAAIESTVAQALEAAPLEVVPLPHLILRGLLPPATYAALLDAIPPDDVFPDRDPIKQNVKIGQLHTAPVWTRTALEYLEDTIIRGILTPALVRRMQPRLESMYAEEYGEFLGARVAALAHGATAGRLMLRRPGYRLEPHLDPGRVAMTCLIYLARPGDDARYGTQLFSVDGPSVARSAKTFYPREHGCVCRAVKTVPFEPNSALVFLNRGGAHGAEIPTAAAKNTRRFSYQFYISPDAAALEELLVASPETERAGS